MLLIAETAVPTREVATRCFSAAKQVLLHNVAQCTAGRYAELDANVANMHSSSITTHTNRNVLFDIVWFACGKDASAASQRGSKQLRRGTIGGVYSVRIQHLLWLLCYRLE